jgi:hypothetical protein
MLFYHPAFDVYHAVFRTVVLLEAWGERWIETERLRIYDFYLLFPHELSTVEMSPLQRSVKKQLALLPQHEAIGNPAKVFYQFEPLFENAIDYLSQQGFITRDRTDVDQVHLRHRVYPADFRRVIDERKELSALVLSTLINELSSYTLAGPRGLKDRTHLLPHRYDRR